MTRNLLQRVARLEAAQRDDVAWPTWLALWRAGADVAGGAAWRDMAAQRRREVIETLVSYETIPGCAPYTPRGC
jgi:hypothetical protein